MLISRSFKRKVVATCGAALGFALLYEGTVFDSQRAAERADEGQAVVRPAAGASLRFSATAYCKGQTTAAGTTVKAGVAAADPDLLPVGSVVQVTALGPRYDGIYTVMDTGPAVQGRELDLYMWSCREALDFGRRTARVTVLRLGWNPHATARVTPASAGIPLPTVAEPPAPAPADAAPVPDQGVQK